MQLFRSVVFFCGWVCTFCNQGSSSLYHEPLIHEGRPYSMNCTSNLSLSDWDFNWESNNGKSVSVCKNLSGCLRPHDNGLQAIMEQTDKLKTSILTIKNTTWEYRGKSFTCIAIESNNGSRREILGVWNISRSYLPPDPPLLCQASIKKGQIIHLSCTTNKVYPDIYCQPVQIFRVMNTSLEIPMHYDTTPSSHQEYYSATCSGNIFPNVSGEYRYCVNSTTAGYVKSYPCTNAVTITNQTTVRIVDEMNTGKLCPGKDSFVFKTSEILWWLSPERPKISCSISDETITNCMVLEKNYSEHPFTSFESQCNFLLTYKHNNKLIKCSVAANNATQEISAEEKIKLHNPPTRLPRFVYKSNENRKLTTFYISNKANVTVECAVEGEPVNSLVTVECFDSFPSEIYRRIQPNQAELSFVFHNDTNCTCTIDHGNNCHSPEAKLTFIKERRHLNASWICLSFHCIKYFLFVIPVVLCTLLILGLYCKSRRKHLEKSICTLFRLPKLSKHPSFSDNDATSSKCGDSKDEHLEVSPYMVVDIVEPNSYLHETSYLSDHLCPKMQCENSTSPHNSPKLPRRKPPPLPVDFSQQTMETTANSDSGCYNKDNSFNSNDSVKGTHMITEVPYCNLLSSEVLPPLPPRARLQTEQKLLEPPPLPLRNTKFNVYTTSPSCQGNNSCDSTEMSSYKYLNNLQSLPKQPPPPIPCGLKSKDLGNIDDRFILDNTKNALTSRFDSHTNQVFNEERTINATTDMLEPSSVRMSPWFQQMWPPPPFRARRQTGKTNNSNKTSKKSKYPANGMVSVNLDEHLEAANNTRLDHIVDTYFNVKAKSLSTKQDFSDTLMSDDCKDGEFDSSRTDNSDVCSSLLTSSSSSSCNSASTM